MTSDNRTTELREKLEADVRQYVLDAWAQGWEAGQHDDMDCCNFYISDMRALLDRQAAITERECFERAAKSDWLGQHLHAVMAENRELQAKLEELDAELGSGTLTAEQVREAIKKHAEDDSCYIFEVYGEMCGPIADELNAMLGVGKPTTDVAEKVKELRLASLKFPPNIRRKVNIALNGIEQAIADELNAELGIGTYIALPTDVAGEPIHIGDVLESTNAFKNWCVVVGIGDATKHDHIIYVKFEAAGDISQTWASKFIHRKPDAEHGERKAVKR